MRLVVAAVFLVFVAAAAAAAAVASLLLLLLLMLSGVPPRLPFRGGREPGALRLGDCWQQQRGWGGRGALEGGTPRIGPLWWE